MPLFLVPIVLGGLSLATGAYGASKIHQGVSGLSTAKKMCEDAQKHFERRVKALDASGRETASELNRLAQERLELRSTTFPKYVDFLTSLRKKVKRTVSEHDSTFLSDFEVDERLKEFKFDSLEAIEVLQGLKSGATLGMATGKAASYVAGQFGVASTGAAISGLSGAAANSAMLAWLGGGSLAAGGGGMALGSIILGGVTVAPALLVGGLTFAKQGQKALTEAEEYVTKARYEVAKVDSQIEFLVRVRRRIQEVREVMQGLDRRALRLLEQLDPETIDPDNSQDASRVAVLDGLMKALSQIVKIPVLTVNGELNLELSELLRGWRTLMVSAN